jgi:hypothetical protein
VITEECRELTVSNNDARNVEKISLEGIYHERCLGPISASCVKLVRPRFPRALGALSKGGGDNRNTTGKSSRSAEDYMSLLVI